MKKYGIIYCAINITNQKLYIGQTIKPLIERRKRHEKIIGYSTKNYFGRALNKYGKNHFIWIILKICYNLKELNKYEKYFIKILNTQNKNIGYNQAPGGNGFIPEKHSHKHSKETKERISINVKETLNKPEIKIKCKKGLKKRWDKIENHEKLSNSIKKLWQNKEYRIKINKTHTKRLKKLWKDNDYRNKQKKLLKKRWDNPTEKEKMLKDFKNQWTNERRKTHSEKIKKLWKDPEYRKSRLEKRKKVNI